MKREPHVPTRTAAIPVALVLVSLLGLAIIPVATGGRASRLWLEISDAADPARTLVSDVQAALGLEMADTRAFLLTGDPRYAVLYREAHDRRIAASAALQRLVVDLGGSSEREVRQLARVLEPADASVSQLLHGGVTAQEFISALPTQQRRFRDAMNIAVSIDRTLRAQIAERRAGIQRLDRVRTMATVVMVICALIAAAAVAALGRRYRMAFGAERLARADSEAARDEARREHERLERVTESRAALIRGFTHDVRNPMGTALGDLRMLEREVAGPLTPAQRGSVMRASRALSASLRLMDDLLTLASADAVDIRTDAADLRTLVAEVADEHRASAAEKGLALKVSAADDVPLFRTDASRVRQILGNLISNAVKYTETGIVEVAVNVEQDRGQTQSRTAIIRVKDTGRGIAAADLPTVFREFQRVASSAGTSGAGIGLAISRRLARALGGDLTVDSAGGVGSVFTLCIPESLPALEPESLTTA